MRCSSPGCERCCAAGQSSAARDLAAGDLRLDPAARRAGAATELDLTTREMALLEFLFRRRRAGLVQARDPDHVWDFDFDGDPNIVEVYVGHLRRKVDRPRWPFGGPDPPWSRVPAGG